MAQRSTDTDSDLITSSDAAKLRGVSRAAINYLVKMGRIRHVEKYGRVLVYRSEVVKYKPLKPGRPSKATTKGVSKKVRGKK
jgi:hypothetical protein